MMWWWVVAGLAVAGLDVPVARAGGAPIKRTLLEVFCGAGLGYCPDGEVVRDAVLAAHPGVVIPVTHHVADAMTFAGIDTLVNYYGPAYPQALIDRLGAPSGRSEWPAAVTAALAVPAIVDVAVSAEVVEPSGDEEPPMIAGTMTATFTSPTSGDLRFLLMVVEDEVIGQGAGYDQLNYSNATAGHPYFGAGNPIVGFPHRWVARGFPLGVWGDGVQIPTNPVVGTPYQQTFLLDAALYGDPADLQLVGAVVRFDGVGLTQRPVLNAVVVDAPTTTTTTTSVTTSTQTGAPTTTLPGCVREATVTSLRCRVDALRVLVDAQVPPGRSRDRLGVQLTRVGRHLDRAASQLGRPGAARHLRRVVRMLAKFIRRLPAEIDPSVRILAEGMAEDARLAAGG